MPWPRFDPTARPRSLSGSLEPTFRTATRGRRRARPGLPFGTPGGWFMPGPCRRPPHPPAEPGPTDERRIVATSVGPARGLTAAAERLLPKRVLTEKV